MAPIEHAVDTISHAIPSDLYRVFPHRQTSVEVELTELLVAELVTLLVVLLAADDDDGLQLQQTSTIVPGATDAASIDGRTG